MVFAGKKWSKAIFLGCIVLLLLTTFPGMAREWKKYSTGYFDIVFEPGLEEHAAQLLREGPGIYEQLSAFYGIELKKRLRVYLMDNVDFSNAYADFFSNVIVIYVNRVPGSFLMNTFDWWVPFVFSHELTHILVANKPSTFKNILGVFGHPAKMLLDTALSPSYLHEGASIYSESLLFPEAGRIHDLAFRSYLWAELEQGNFYGFRFAGGFSSPVFTPVGMNYLYGASFFDFLETKYGTSSVSELVGKQMDGFPWSLKGNVQELTGRKLREVYEAWEAFEWEKFQQNTPPNATRPPPLVPSGYQTGMLREANDGVFFVLQREGEGTQWVWMGPRGTQSNWANPYPVDFDVNSRGEVACIFGSGDGLESYDQALYLGEWEKELLVVRQIQRPSQVRWWGDDTLLFTTLEHGGTSLWMWQVEEGEPQPLLRGSPDFFLNSFSPFPGGVVASITFGEDASLYLLSFSPSNPFPIEVEALTDASANDWEPFVKDRKVYFSSDREGVSQVWELGLSDRSLRRLTQDPLGATQPVVASDELVYRGYSANGFSVYSIPLEPLSSPLVQPSAPTFEIQDAHDSTAFSLEEGLEYQKRIDIFSFPFHTFPVPRVWIPLLLPRWGIPYGLGAIAGWDDLKQWIWLGMYAGAPDPEFEGQDVHFAMFQLLHRGKVPFSLGLDELDGVVNAQLTVEYPMILRNTADVLQLVPRISFTAQDILDWDMDNNQLDLEWNMAVGSVGYPNYSVYAPRFYSQFSWKGKKPGFRTGIGFRLPWSSTGMFQVSAVEDLAKVGIESWTPLPVPPIGTRTGSWRFNGMAVHLGGYVKNEFPYVEGLLGFRMDFAFQYWVDIQFRVDLLFEPDGVLPVIGFDFSDLP